MSPRSARVLRVLKQPGDVVVVGDAIAVSGLIPRMIAGYGLPEHLRITIGTEAEVKAVQASLAKFVAASK